MGISTAAETAGCRRCASDVSRPLESMAGVRELEAAESNGTMEFDIGHEIATMGWCRSLRLLGLGHARLDAVGAVAGTRPQAATFVNWVMGCGTCRPFVGRPVSWARPSV